MTIADRDFDPYVKRTRDRPLAARRISPYEAIGVFVALALARSGAGTAVEPHCSQILAVIGCAIAVSYPFVKRFFALPQFYLGAAFAWGVPMAFAAELGDGAEDRLGDLLRGDSLGRRSTTLLYAMVDREDDLKIGINSTAILFGDADRVIIGAMQLMVLFGLYLVGRERRLGFWYGLGLAGRWHLLSLSADPHPRARAGALPAARFSTTTISAWPSSSVSRSTTSSELELV